MDHPRLTHVLYSIEALGELYRSRKMLPLRGQPGNVAYFAPPGSSLTTGLSYVRIIGIDSARPSPQDRPTTPPPKPVAHYKWSASSVTFSWDTTKARRHLHFNIYYFSHSSLSFPFFTITIDETLLYYIHWRQFLPSLLPCDIKLA
jgi:hypothetical protein